MPRRYATHIYREGWKSQETCPPYRLHQILCFEDANDASNVPQEGLRVLSIIYFPNISNETIKNPKTLVYFRGLL